MSEKTHEHESGRGRKGLLVVEVISEGPHCVPCQYAIAAVKHVSASYQGRIELRVIETKKIEDAARYLDICRMNGGPVPVPAILFAGRLAFDQIPGPDELCRALDTALLEWEGSGD